MKDYQMNVTNEDINNLLFKNDFDFTIDIIQGALNDNYFIDDFNLGLKFSRGKSVKPRKHLMILENYENEWGSSLILTLTDNNKKYYTTKRDYLSDYLKENKKGAFLDKDEKDFYREELQECVKQLAN